MTEELLETAINQVKLIGKSYDTALDEIKKRLKDMPVKERAVVNAGIGKVEKLMKKVQFPSLESISNDSDFIKANNEIINKLGEVAKEFEKLRESCLS
jgi:hypothetical protein